LENMATPNVAAPFRSMTEDSVAVVKLEKQLDHERELLSRTKEEFDSDVSTPVSRLCCFAANRAYNTARFVTVHTTQNTCIRAPNRDL